MPETLDVIHVHPVRDAQDHDLNGGRCWCRPELDIRHDRIIVLHHDAAHRKKWQPRIAESEDAVVRNAL